MISSDLSKVTLDAHETVSKIGDMVIPTPTNEPIIGVIDNLFDENVYFSEWVDNTDYLDEYELGRDKDTY